MMLEDMLQRWEGGGWKVHGKPSANFSGDPEAEERYIHTQQLTDATHVDPAISPYDNTYIMPLKVPPSPTYFPCVPIFPPCTSTSIVCRIG
jgi:hypothetical protein